jgi:murein DD-endopeptidase MepM/ murein hydrolase activator NlpD
VFRSKQDLQGLTADWDGEKIVFWKEADELALTNGVKWTVWKAFLGVDLEKPPGKYELHVNTIPAQQSCNFTVNVIEGNFRTERLQVERQFVQPDPEQVQRAKNEQKKLRELYAIATPEKLWRGSFRLPLDGEKLGGNFGTRRILNGEPRSPHSGVDFPSPTGTAVHATQSGKIVLAEPLFFAGNTVIIDHGLGMYSLYGHLSEILVHVGDLVDTGNVLGKVGATGRVTGPHLHWGLSVAGARVNALQAVKLLGVYRPAVRRHTSKAQSR